MGKLKATSSSATKIYITWIYQRLPNRETAINGKFQLYSNDYLKLCIYIQFKQQFRGLNHGVWVHVDAAYAGSALVCPEFGHVIDGVESVDSFSMNAHKWLLTNNDCCAMWVKKPSELIAALGTEQEYILKDSASEGHEVVDYKDWTMTLTRRFRALKMWLVLRCYGIDGLREHIRSHVRMAEAFENMVRADERFEVVTDRQFALVCFRLRSPEKYGGEKTANELNRGLLEEVNAVSLGPYMSSASVGGMYMLRCAVGSTLTEEHHVSDAWKVVQDRAASILRKMEIIYSVLG
ncbi:hypothetical protein BRADI_2g51160v3 [Brachypodium distachyon]|uniref:Uncharacterized protein n=1 Tax=Brachypodium distachyon TaxID=15368 RepID=A0A0Q3GFT0_BRADI|nr:hypothetical protein BRADI_2g51160v3 [Brachypodium distachyon]